MNQPISSMDKPDYLLGDEMICGDCHQPSIGVDADTIARCKNPDCRRNKAQPAA
jgi:hypothetical protein